MKNNLYKLGILLVLLVQLNNSIAQTKIWGVGSGVGEADAQFSNAFVNSTTASGYSTTQWTALTVYESGGVVTPGNAYWVRNLTGVSQGGYATGMTALASPSAANGAALFDSDFMDNGGVVGAFGTGTSPSPHKGELISPRIDLTGNTDQQLAVKFYSYYRRFDITNYTISISTDDGASWVESVDIQVLQPVAVNADVEGAVTAIFNTATQGVANLTQCRIKFTFDGDYYYAFVDDITIEDILPNIPNIVISEIMFNPPEAGTDSLEFIEIYNNDAVAVDLTNYTLAGVTYTFPSVILNPGEFYVVAVNSSAFNNVFGSMPDGVFTGGLSNGGEFVTIKDASGNLVDSVRYFTSAPWPTDPNGQGPSLVLCDVNADNNDGNNWNASVIGTGVIINGKEVKASPGVANFCCPVLSGADTQVACDSLVWIDGNTYYSNNTTATFITQTAQGCDSTVTLNLTVTTSPSNQTVSASQASFCPGGGSATVDLASSETGVRYYLRNDANDTIVAGPVFGTGNALSFNTGVVNTTTTYNVYAQTYALDAINLPSTNDHIRFNSPFSAYGNAISVESWINNTNGEFPWAGQGTPAVDNMTANVWLWHGGTWYVNDNGTWRSLAWPVLPNGWVHVATVADASGMRIYYNGVQVASNASGITSTIRNNGSSVIDLGHDVRFVAGTGGRNSNVAFDNFNVWNVSRSAVEIAADYNNCLVGNESGLVQYTKFNEGTGSVFSSVVGSNGQLINASTNWFSGSNVCTILSCPKEMAQLVTISVNDNTPPVPDVSNLPDITGLCVVDSLTAPTATDDCSGNTRLTILPPTSIAGVNTNVGVASFGPQTFYIGAQSVIAQDITPDSLCCDTITNDYTGKIAVMYRGACSFTQKVKYAQVAGAIGAIIVNNQGGTTVEDMTGSDPSIVIPILMLSTDEGLALMNEINLGNVDVIMERKTPIIITHNATLPITTPGTTVVTWTYDDGNGNTSTQNQNVVIPSIDNTIDNSLMPVLTANQSGATYRWLDCDNGNSPISGETGQTFTASVNGNYAVEITMGGCVDTSACEAVTGVGVKEIANNSVSIYPNPTNGTVSINLGSNNTLVNYSITSIEGRIVETGRTSTNNIVVDLSKEGNGVYFIKINTESTSIVYKLIKQ